MRVLLATVWLLGVGCGEDAPAAAPALAAAPAVDEAPPEAPRTWVEVDDSTVGPALRDHAAPALLVNVWSTWCEPCVEELPELVTLGAQYRGRGLGLALVASEAPSNRAAAWEMLESLDAPHPRYLKTGPDDPFIRALHAEWSGALPATLLLDRQRRVRHFWEGPVSSADLRGPVEALLGENP